MSRKKFLIASIRKNAGKTSVILGLSLLFNGRVGYLKPLGDRLLYKKKRLWDYDSALITSVLKLEETPEEMTIGFDHSKLKFMYTEESIKDKLTELLDTLFEKAKKNIVFIEGTKDFSTGASVFLDALHISKITDSNLILVLSGEPNEILDDLSFLKKYVNIDGINLAGIIINKVKDVEDFKMTYLDEVESSGVKVLGILPFEEKFTTFTAAYLRDILFARVVAGEKGIDNTIKNIFVGAMSANEALKNPLFSKKNKLIITSGDRSDMILAALESDTACIVLSNNILPPPNILSIASAKKVPLLLVPSDTFHTAKMVDDMDILLAKDENDKISTLKELIKENIDLSLIF